MMYAATALRKARLKKGLTQEAVGLILKMRRPHYLSHIELGKAPVSVKMVKLLAPIYGFEINRIINLMVKDYKEKITKKMNER
jgi:transcriptional regulator with XRE-family HTH domain